MKQQMLQFNIGLENNPITEIKDYANLFYNMLGCSPIKNVSIETMTYEGKPERTIVFRTECRATARQLKSKIEWLCTITEQDMIPFKANGKGYMVYNPSYEGEKYKFDDQYFKTPE